MKIELKYILEDSGWYEGRSIETGYMIEDLLREGYVIKNPEIYDLLKEYWNLNVIYKCVDGKQGNIRLNTEVINDIEKNIVDEISKTVKDELVPVGLINEGSALLFVGNSGAFYMAVEGKFYKIANNFYDTLDTIIYQKEVLRII